MKRSLIGAGLVAALLACDVGDAIPWVEIPRAEAQVAIPPANTTNLTPQQRQRVRQMMRRRRHHRHRHKIPVTPTVPATSMIPNLGIQNAMRAGPKPSGPILVRHRGHHHRRHRNQSLMAQIMMRQMLLYQMLQAQAMQSQLAVNVASPNRPANPNQNLTAQRKRQIAAQIQRASF
jgi:hypothetical protein